MTISLAQGAKYLKLLKNKTSYRKGQPAAQQVVSGLLGI